MRAMPVTQHRIGDKSDKQARSPMLRFSSVPLSSFRARLLRAPSPLESTSQRVRRYRRRPHRGSCPRGRDRGRGRRGQHLPRVRRCTAWGCLRSAADSMGMLGTVMNVIALEAQLTSLGQAGAGDVGRRDAVGCRNLYPTAGDGPSFQGPYRPAGGRHREPVLHHRYGRRAPGGRTRMRDALLKATQVDGIYDADPRKDKNAKRYETVRASTRSSARISR